MVSDTIAGSRPAKRVKTCSNEDANLISANSKNPSLCVSESSRLQMGDTPLSGEESQSDGDLSVLDAQPTELESIFPPANASSEAVSEYESSFIPIDAVDIPAGFKERLKTSKWARGRSSIYVDAFNLALSTVLEEEGHLFDDFEKAFFDQWYQLDYEAQYLYVRLFLRKTAAWHRIRNIGYQSDISNINLAVDSLQASRRAQCPLDLADVRQSSECAQEIASKSEVRTFHFADTSDDQIKTLEEASSLLSLEELKGFAKDAKVKGKNKAELLKNLRQMSNRQSGLSWNILRRHDDKESFTTGKPAPVQEDLNPSLSPFATSTEKMSAGDSSIKHSNHPPELYISVKDQQGDGCEISPDAPTFRDNNRDKLFVSKILGRIGPCIRLNLATAKVFERVHLVYYRSTEWTEGSLVTIILARIQRRNFPQYIVSRSKDIFPSRSSLVEFEAAIKLQFEADNILENGTIDQKGLERVLEIFEAIYPKWKILIHEEQAKEDGLYDSGEGAYLRRFSPGWVYTRIVHKATYAMGRLKQYEREHQLLRELLDQRLFHPVRRGGWHQRKALLEEHYMAEVRAGPSTVRAVLDKEKRHWKRVALDTCEKGLQDRDCHLIYHYDLQKRIKKLEKALRIAKREQHDFGHVSLTEPVERMVEGVRIQKEISDASISQINENRRGTKTIWLDETEGGGECTVEALCLSWYREQGWKGYHAEGGIIRTIFAYLFYDILFMYVPNVFQTRYQTCPLDLHTDAFYPTRVYEINRRLVDIENGESERFVREVDRREREKRTSVIGLNWDFEVDDILEIVTCFDGPALATVCKVMAQEYRERGGGVPDLFLWKPSAKQVMFAEVKSENDRLSDTQRLWIHVLSGAGIRVELCNALAREVRVRQ